MVPGVRCTPDREATAFITTAEGNPIGNSPPSSPPRTQESRMMSTHEGQEERQERYQAALGRYRRTESPAAREALRDARLDLEGHGEQPEEGSNT